MGGSIRFLNIVLSMSKRIFKIPFKCVFMTFFVQVLLEQQLAVEKSKMETEKKRFQNAMDEKVGFQVLFSEIRRSVFLRKISLKQNVRKLDPRHEN